MVRSKVCGITRVEDALHAAGVGADFIGLIFAESPRRVDPTTAAGICAALKRSFPAVGRVGVFVEPNAADLAGTLDAVDLTHLQIYGDVPSARPSGVPWIAALRVSGPDEVRLPDGDPWAVLVEPKVQGRTGGTGRTFPWHWVAPILERARVFVAGGLSAATVGDLLGSVTPFGVDASSKLERSPGIKDPAKVQAFVEAVRGNAADEESR